MNKQIKYALCGIGYWGNNIKNTLDKLNFPLVRTCDLVGEGFTGIPHSDKLDDILNDKEVNAVIVCVPPQNHFKVVSKCLEKGLATWCEKPLTTKLTDADALLQIIGNSKTILHCDFTFCYSGEYFFIQNALKLNRFGTPLTGKLTWAANGKRQICGAILDLAPHLISQLFGWFGCPSYLSATAVKANNITQSSNIIFTYSRDFKVYGEVSWLSPDKIRRTEITTDKGVLSTDYQGRVEFKTFDGELEEFDICDMGSPLEVQLIHFNQCVLNGTQTLSDGPTGARIVQICELLEKSALSCGAEQKL